MTLGLMRNWIQRQPRFAPSKDERGVWVLRLPLRKETKMSSVDVRDTGSVVKAILQRREELRGSGVGG